MPEITIIPPVTVMPEIIPPEIYTMPAPAKQQPMPTVNSFTHRLSSSVDKDTLTTIWEVDELPLEEAKANLAGDIDRQAETCRLKYITAGSGMAMTYQEKLAQARAVLEIGAGAKAADYPTLAASIGVEAKSLAECAQLVVSKYEQFAQLSGLIERERLVAKKGIKEASDLDETLEAYEAATWP